MAWTQIASLNSPTAGAFTFTGLSLGSYDFIEILIGNVTVTTDDTEVYMTFYVSSSEITSGYLWTAWGRATDDDQFNSQSSSDTNIHLTSSTATEGVGNATNETFMGVAQVMDPGGSVYKMARFRSAYVDPAGTFAAFRGSGMMPNTGAIDGIKIAGDSNLTAGKVRIIGWS